MNLSEYIKALQALEKKHGGELRVTTLSPTGSVTTKAPPSLAHVAEKKGRETKTRYWASWDKGRKIVEEVIKL